MKLSYAKVLSNPLANVEYAFRLLPLTLSSSRRSISTHLIQRPCYQRGSPCKDPAGDWTTRRPPDHRKETQTAVVWSCFPFIRFGQNHLARHSERGKKTRRQRKRWEDNIREWTGLEFGNGENWLQNHMWCPNDPRG